MISMFIGLGLNTLLFASPDPRQQAELLILTPHDLSPAAEALACYRRETGLSVRVEPVDDLALEGKLDPERVKARVLKIHAQVGEGLRYLLLLGDAPAPADSSGTVRIPPRILPVSFADERWAHPEELASDTWYGMLDGDLIPELSVGRLPADDLRGALGMVERIIAYERSTDFGTWRKRLEIVAGTAGFGPMEDALLETVARRYISEFIDPAYDITVTWANPSSPWAPLPSRFAEKVLERFNAGSLIGAFIGHGRAHDFGGVKWKGKRYPGFRLAEARRVALERGSPIIVLIACSTGWFDHDRSDCISEVLLGQPRGPVAVFSSTRISQPYADAIIGRELIENLMTPACERLGDAILAGQTALAEPRGEDQKVLDDLARLIMRPETLAPCRADHIYLYTLFGDPSMVVGYPRGKAELSAPERPALGQTIEISCTLDREYRGRAVLTLEGHRGRILRELVPTAGLEGEALAEATAENWTRANDLVVARRELEVSGTSFTTPFAIPADGLRPGEYLFKLFLEDPQGCALGAIELRLEESSGK